MRQKTMKGLVLAGCAALLLTFAGCSSDDKGDAKKVVRLKMNHTVAETSLWHTYSLKYAEKIKERTEGRYIIDVFANEQLAAGAQAKTLEMLRAGTIDIDLHSMTIWAGIDSRLGIGLMPWIFPSYEDVDAFNAGEGKKILLDIVRENGCVPIALGENGYRQVLNTRRPFNTPEDLKNVKIRVPGMTMFVDFYRALTADPTTMNWGEVFSALQQGTIDGMESPPEIIQSGRFQEVNKYMTMWNAAYDGLMLSMSKKLFDSLSDADKKIFLETGEEVMAEQIKAQREKNAQAAKELESEIAINYLTPEQMAEFRKMVQPVYDKYAKEYPDNLKKAIKY